MSENGSIDRATSMGAVRLTVVDLEGMRDFYRDPIGLAELAGEADVVRLGADSQSIVELVGDPDAAPRPRGTSGLFHLAILVPTRADLARALQRVAEAGWRLSGASDHLVSEALYLSDPEGNGIELYRDRPREEWPVRDGVLVAADEAVFAPQQSSALTAVPASFSAPATQSQGLQGKLNGASR